MQWLLDHFEELLGSILLAIMALIAFINVIVRYLTSFSFAWTEEVTINFFVWVVLLGTARAFRTGGHLGMSIIYDTLPRSARYFCILLSVFAGLIFFVALIATGIQELIDEISLNVTTESMGIPVWLYTIATPLFSLLVIIRMLQRAWHDLRKNAY